MANATARVPISTTPWGDSAIKRVPLASAKTFYPGMMIALNATGYAVSCDDTTAIRFDGINANTVRTQVFSDDAQADLSADQSRQITVERPWRFTMLIASAAAGDEGRALYAVDDNHVGYTSSNSILVGWVDQVLSATLVLVNPLFGPLTNLAVASNTLTFTGTTGADTIVIPDNLADALSVVQGAFKYLTFTTTDGSELTKVLGVAATAVTNAGGGVQLTGGIGGATSGAGGVVTIAGGAGTNGNAAGGAVTSTGGAGQGSAAGGACGNVGGAGGATGAGGAASLIGGASGATSGTGGAVTITAGASPTSGTGGAVNVTAGASTTSGGGGAVVVTGGAGGGGTNAGGHVNLVGGAAVSTGLPGEVQVNGVAGLCEVNWQQFLAANVPVSGTSYPVYLANRAMRVKAVRIVCSSTSTVPTVDVTKDTGTTAPGGGTTVLTGVATFSATANTVVAGTLVSTVATLTLAAGDRLSIKWAGTVGSITGAAVNILLEPC